ncbi:MAG TPA: IPT/TIG domain-containing protein, partial [Candidatus Limnocylindria bacterium]|nr:IPT/TIG domain-containing protein [Candidatus Limnocylindria bacterium]
MTCHFASRFIATSRFILTCGLIASVLLPLIAPIAQASTPVEVGYRDFDFGSTVTTTPTGEKPESKLWWADGFWWGVLWSPSSNAYTIHKLNLTTQDWVSTGVIVDQRSSAKVDVLWDGTRLYVASHIFTLNPAPSGGPANAGRVYRFSYNTSTDTYSLDSGFPVTVNDSKSEVLVLDKDSTGKLWITWAEGNKVKVNRSTTNDLTWGTPFDLPVQGNNLNSDDLCSLVKFGGNKIGIMWTNQTDQKDYFAVHLDGTADTSWQPREEAYADAGLGMVADDHINLKASCAADGAVYAVVKTNLGLQEPLIVILKRTSAGVWSQHTVALGEDNHSRPQMLIDTDANRIYVFAPDITPSTPFVIYMKSASLSNLQFPGGLGTPFISSSQDIRVNNPTTTKQCVNGATGIVVLASDQDTHFYLHNYLDLSGTAPTISSFTPGSGVLGTQVTITGQRFTGATQVAFNNVPATFTVDNSTQIRANVPAGATTGPIRVTTPSGVGTSTTSFNVIVPPTVTFFTPTTGPAGASVTVFGTGFTTTNAVRFNGVLASGFAVSSDTSLSATVPASATSGPISVTTSTGSDTSAASFTVIVPPTITSFTPPSGPGGSEVTVTGTGFATATLVKFNGSAASFVIDGPTQLRATVPGAFATGPISVTNPAGTATTATNFVVTGPVITGFSPASGMPGTQVTIDGSGFLNTTAVAFNGAPAAFIIDSNIRVRAIVPTGASTGRISVTSPDGFALSGTNFIAIVPPTITSFTPDRGAIGANITILGREFNAVSAVTFNGTAATTFTALSDTVVQATVPSGATSGRIGITTAGGSALSPSNFLILGPPPTNTFSPAADAHVHSQNTSTNYGTVNHVRVRGGSGGTYNTYLKFNLVGVGTSIRGAKLRLFCTDESPDGGAVYLVSNNFQTGGVPWTESGLTWANAPTIGGTALTPNQAVAANTWEEYDITSAITGDGTYSFGLKNNNNTNSAFYNSKEATTNQPQLIIETNVFPGVGAFSPAMAQVGAVVTVNGTGFTGATSVKFNGLNGSFNVVNDSLLTATVPAGASSGPISVTNAVGTATSATNFTVIVAPQITTFAPVTGPVGTEVQVHGVGFATTNTFRFNGTPGFFTIDSDTLLRAIVPGGATSGPLTVINSLGSINSAQSFIVIRPPTVTSFTPPGGIAGTEVTVRGTNFGTASAVKFNGTAATFTVDSDTLLRANVPVGASSGPISVVNPGGTGTSTANFAVVTVPAITSFTPTSGPVGVEVTVRGFNFTASSAVRFNGSLATFTVDNDTLLRANVPVGASSGPISITNPAGTANSASSFTVILPPTVTTFVPTSAPVGIQIAVHGTRFTTASSVKFNGTTATFTIDSDTLLHATVPVGATSGQISVTNPAGTANSPASFVVIVPPTISGFTPANGPVGAVIEVQGSSFSTATAVRFNGVAASFTIDSDAILHATVPLAATSGTISVQNPAGTATSSGTFTVIPLPAITTFTPTSGPVGIEVTVRGINFSTTSAVRFNGTVSTFTVDSDTLLRANVPAGATTGPISVTNMAGTAASAASFTVIPSPAVTSFTPASGPVGTEVTVRGTSFTTTSAVRFNGTLATFTVDSDTLLRANVPAGATTGPISVQNPAGTGTSASSFNVILPPIITFFSPTSGGVGVEVAVHGSSFTTASAVRFNGTAATFTVDSDTLLRANVPAGATTGPISVTNPAATVASSGTFTVNPAPTITTFTPASGPVGTQVTVRGTSFTGVTAVRFNGVTASFTVDSDTLLRANVPVSATSGPINVQNPGGSATSATNFTVLRPPTVTAFSPMSGPVGIEVTISGSGFSGTSAVRFNGTLSSFIIDSDAQIRATVPAGATTGPISVTNPIGTFTSGPSFTVLPPPAITFFTPVTGPVGAEVTVHGLRFTGASSVKFNGVAATFTVDSDTLLRATVPVAASSGPISVTSSTGTGTSAASFTVINPPTIASFTPTSGAVGAEVTVRGTSFTTASAVRFNGTVATFTVDSDTLLRANVPAGASSGPISVQNPSGTFTSAASFSVTPPPTIASFSPTTGPVGTQVTVRGTSFSTASAVRFNGTTATFTVDSDTLLRANVPAGATTGPISVQNPAGTASTVANFIVIPAPTVASFTPTSGPAGAQITVRGTSFTTASAVRFNGVLASFTVDSDTLLRANVPVAATSGPISVTNVAGTGASAANFSVVFPPSISSFTPTSGAIGTEVTLNGSGFATASAVRFNGVVATFTAEGDTVLRANVPAGATTGPISVTNPAGTFTSGPNFTVIPPPTITFFTPTSGPVGIQVTVHGTSFSSASAVRFNGTVATFTVDSDTLLRANVPAGATSGPISVTNTGGVAASATSFTVILPPTIVSFAPTSGGFGSEVTVRGTSFTVASAVRFNGMVASFTVDSDTLLRANVPVFATSGPISVTNVAGTATSVSSFTVIPPPTITSFTPTSGPVGVEVTVQGSGFAGATSVKFNGTSATFTIDNDGQLRANVPAGATTGPISVTNASGTFTSGPDFTVIPPPVIASFTPTAAAVGVEVTVRGTNFTGASSVKFNGTAATFTVDSDTLLRANVPGLASSGPISVTTVAGTGTSASSFTVIRPPVISSFTPGSGLVGTEVTVRGTNFTTASAVRFNGTLATFTVDSDTLLRANVPAGATTGPISVTNPLGTFASGASFTVFVTPSIASFSPVSGPIGMQVTVRGTGLTGASAVRFNGTLASFTVDSDTLLRANVPAGATTGPISVQNPAGTGTSAASFTVVVAPTITSFSPASGAVGVEVTVRGTSFTTASAVRFNGTVATFTVDSDTLLRANVPAGATTGPISVQNPGGTATSAASFTVNPPPAITFFTPSSGLVGSEVTVHGASFSSTSAVRFNGTVATFTVDSDTLLRANVPVGATSGPISVQNPGGTATSAASFTVILPPSISSFFPTSGPVGTEVTVSGSGFSGATAVRFNGTLATFTIDSDAQLRANVPAGATTGPISVTNAAGSFATGADFTVIPTTAITFFTPASGPVGAEVSVHGASFTGATAVRFNGTVATFTVDSDTLLRANVPAGATSGPISVQSPGGSATSATSFTLIVAPTIVSFAPASGPIGTEVTVRGSSFTTASAVRFNGTVATFTVDSDTLLRANVPVGATTGLISVQNPAGTTNSATSFTVVMTPTIAFFTPADGPVGTQVTVHGTNFAGSSAVRFNGTVATFTVDSDTVLRANVPAGATTGPISVQNAAGTATSGTNFTVIHPATIASFAPASGPIGTEVTVRGTSFTTASAVRFNGPLATFTVDSDTLLRAN